MFVGRKDELARLEDYYAKGTFQMIILYGRRRVGKTTLVSEFAKGKRTLFFTALVQSDANNLSDFSRKCFSFFELAGLSEFSSWTNAFDFIAQKAAEDPFVLVFDEFPYAAQANESLPSVLQIAIDHKLKETGLFMVLCGSNQGFMENKVLGKKSPLHGRRTAQMKVGPLGYLEASHMLLGLDPQEVFRYYGCFGGVPYYLSLIDLQKGFHQNLSELFFDPSGFLYEEPLMLLRQELREPALYNSVLRAIAGGANKSGEIANRAGIAPTTLPKYLTTLIALDIIEKVVPFGENPRTSKKGIYRIKDACYDFWYSFVMPYTSDIEAGAGSVVARNLPDQQISGYLGKRFERLCAEWLMLQVKKGTLPILATSVSSWWGPDPEKRKQSDIDVLAADRVAKKLIIGECKYREDFNESEAIEDLESKRSLVNKYKASHLIIFSKRAVAKTTLAKRDTRSDLDFKSLEDLYD
jgi:AAA+ ATPase superfamily predicted ATPase